MLAKLANISKKAYLEALTLEAILKTAEKFGLSLQTEKDANGNVQLVFNNGPKTRWDILKILDDDYLESAMTTLLYETNSKLAV